jgi:hypothetical protein
MSWGGEELLQSGFDGFGDGFAEEIITLGVEVDVVGILHRGEMRGDGGEEVVDDDAVLFHNHGSGGVEEQVSDPM